MIPVSKNQPYPDDELLNRYILITSQFDVYIR